MAPKSETRLKQTQNKRHKAPSGPPSVSTWGRAGRQVERKEKEKRVTGSVTRMSVSLCLSAAFSANRAPFYFNGKDNRSAQQTVRERDKSSQQWLTTGTTRSSHRPTAAFSAKKKKRRRADGKKFFYPRARRRQLNYCGGVSEVVDQLAGVSRRLRPHLAKKGLKRSGGQEGDQNDLRNRKNYRLSSEIHLTVAIELLDLCVEIQGLWE